MNNLIWTADYFGNRNNIMLQKKVYYWIGLVLFIMFLLKETLFDRFSININKDIELMEKHFKGQSQTIKKLEHCGFRPRAILDVGANLSHWSNDLSKIFKTSDFFMIEGNDKHINTLKTIGFPFEIALVGDKVRNISYYKSIENGDGTGNI